jgi:hypothetical protein
LTTAQVLAPGTAFRATARLACIAAMCVMAMSGLGISEGIRSKESGRNQINPILPDARAIGTSAEP